MKKRIDRSYLTEEDVWKLRDKMGGFRDQLILDILLATGMRPGELFALRWSDVLAGSLYVDEGFTRGRMEEPKTATSIGAVAVPAEIMDRLSLWCADSKPAAPTDMIFPTQTGTPMDSANWRKRVLQPAAELAGLRVNFQMLRRTVATLSIQAGVTVKAVQAQLRHASAETTMNVYAQVVTAAQGEAAEKMFRLMKPRKPPTETPYADTSHQPKTQNTARQSRASQKSRRRMRSQLFQPIPYTGHELSPTGIAHVVSEKANLPPPWATTSLLSPRTRF